MGGIRQDDLDSRRHAAVDDQKMPAILLPGSRAAKRCLDILVASMALFFLAPLMTVIAVAIALETGRPVIFRQTRVGQHFRPFVIFKFRTMFVAPDEGTEVIQAARHDGRVTRLGRLLRKTSLDELPQLWNVLRGEMSLVGPRPHALAHDIAFSFQSSGYSHRYYVKPGITGLAQVNGARGETGTPEVLAARIEMDRRYIETWSLLLDLKILAVTAWRMWCDSAAY
jgi:lipopolysaccharide/colanic/teichoic acid biosynthesis glycosyltransferase